MEKVLKNVTSEKLYVLYYLPDILQVIKSRRMGLAGHEAQMRERRDAYRVLVRKPERKKPVERPRLRREDNIKMDFQVVGWEGMDWTDLAEDRDRW
jgi:hypothetical protein